MEAEKRLDLSYSLFKGCSFRLKNVSTDDDADVAAQKISEMPKVRKIWPVRVRNVPKDEIVWVGDGAAASLALKRRQESANDTFSPHVMTQVDKLREKGFTGAGVRIGIVDTGVDYNRTYRPNTFTSLLFTDSGGCRSCFGKWLFRTRVLVLIRR